MTEQELTDIALKAERYNGAGRDTVLQLVARVRDLQRRYEPKERGNGLTVDPFETLHDTLTMRGT